MEKKKKMVSVYVFEYSASTIHFRNKVELDLVFDNK